MLSILLEDPRQPEVLELIEYSDTYSASLYPEECRYPVGIAFLAGPAVRFFIARIAGLAMGCGAMVIGPDHTAELKRIIVRPEARGRGIGRALLDAIVATASHADVGTLLLETGPQNLEALNLYRRFGFQQREPFGFYRESPHSVFMEKKIVKAA
jgi:putative acetyltransferase